MSSAASPLGVAVIGLGIGEQHARAYAALGDCRVRVLCDLDQDKARRLAGLFEGSEVVADFQAILDRPDVDILSICSFDEAHYDQVMQALAAGKHVFVEKPLCRTEAELGQIRRRLDAAGHRLHLGSNLVLRGAEIYRWLRQEIAAGAFGEIYAFDGDYLYGRLHKITEGWRKDSDDYSVMLGGGIHLIDLMLWLTGQRPRQIASVGNAISTRGTGFPNNDFSAATMLFDSGMIGRITANFGCVHRHQHAMRIFGTKKTFILDDAGPRLCETRDPAVTATRLPQATLPVAKGVLIPDFVAGIRRGPQLDSGDLMATLDSISVAITCDKAMKNGTTETVTYA